jgi:HK97 family phage prohead protease
MMNTVARSGLFRTAHFTLAVRDGGSGEGQGDGLSLNGYAAVFGVPTRINSWEGIFDETVRAGAFKKSLRETTPVMQFDHGRHPMIGSIPIGTYDSLSEDDTGLAVAGRLADNWLIQPVRDAISSGAVSGMSFRFDAIRDAWTDVNGNKVSPQDDSFWEMLYLGDDHPNGPLQRELIEVRMPEAGPVVFPAYTETSVSVRAQQLARTIRSDGALAGEVRSALALGRGPGETMGLPGDEALRSEIARAILFGTAPGTRPATRTDAPPAPEGHPSDVAEVDDDDLEDPLEEEHPVPADGHPGEQDTEPAEGRSAERDDAPAKSHPSQTPQQRRQQVARQALVTRLRVGKAR